MQLSATYVVQFKLKQTYEVKKFRTHYQMKKLRTLQVESYTFRRVDMESAESQCKDL